ncbi:hypothetical protein BsWGS_20484 [Bradybaena similaris]
MKDPDNSSPVVSISHCSFQLHSNLHGYISPNLLHRCLCGLPFLLYPNILPSSSTHPSISSLSQHSTLQHSPRYFFPVPIFCPPALTQVFLPFPNILPSSTHSGISSLPQYSILQHSPRYFFLSPIFYPSALTQVFLPFPNILPSSTHSGISSLPQYSTLQHSPGYFFLSPIFYPTTLTQVFLPFPNILH